MGEVDRVAGCLARQSLQWNNLLNVITDRSLNLTGKDISLLRGIQHRVREDNPSADLIFALPTVHHSKGISV